MPAGACDSHVHVIGDRRRYPMLPDRGYTPGEAPVDALKTHLRESGIERVVLVQPSFYGTDNACLLDALDRLGASARGVAVVDEETGPAELARLARCGVRGARINLKGFENDPDRIADLAQKISRRVATHGWHLQAFLRLRTVVSLHDVLAALPTPIVLDHFAGASTDGLDQPGIDALLPLLDSGTCFIKLSAPYHASRSKPDYPEMRSLARILIAHRRDRMLWGSDWPHTNSTTLPGTSALDIHPLHAIDNAALIRLIAEWIPTVEARKRVLVDNPAALFGFDED